MRTHTLLVRLLVFLCAIARAVPVPVPVHISDTVKSQIGLGFGIMAAIGNVGWGWISWKSLEDNKKAWWHLQLKEHAAAAQKDDQHKRKLTTAVFCFTGTASGSGKGVGQLKPVMPCMMLAPPPAAGQNERRRRRRRRDVVATAGEKAQAMLFNVPADMASRLDATLVAVRQDAQGKLVQVQETIPGPGPGPEPLSAAAKATTTTTAQEEDEKKRKAKRLADITLALGIINSIGTIPGLIMTLINAEYYRGNPKVD